VGAWTGKGTDVRGVVGKNGAKKPPFADLVMKNTKKVHIMLIFLQ